MQISEKVIEKFSESRFELLAEAVAAFDQKSFPTCRSLPSGRPICRAASV
jgi:hypothetical protein